MPNDPTFTVVIPSYNYGRYLTSTIESVLSQDRNDVEIILIDDASTDNTPEIAQRFKHCLRYIRNESNLGAGGAWKVGVNIAKGDFLIKLDADDELLPGHLCAVEEAFASDDAIGLVATSVVVNHEDDGIIETEYISEADVTLTAHQLRSKLLRSFFFRMPGCVLRRSIIEGHEPPDPNLYQIHDWEFFLRVTRGHKARLLKNAGGVYRIHSNSITATAQFDNRLYKDIVRWLALAQKEGPRHIPKEEERILRGSCGELLLIGFGPKLKPSSYWRYIFKYFKACSISMQGGLGQLLRVQRSFIEKIFRKALGRTRPAQADY